MINWYSVGLSAFVGAVASVIATLVMPNRKESKSTYIIFILALFFVLNSLAKHYILIPHEITKAKRSFIETPVIQVLKKYDPSTFNSIMRSLEEGLKGEHDTQKVISQMRSEVDQMLQKRLPIASDDALLTYMSVMIREMRELDKQDPAICSKALAPQRYGSISIKDYIPKDLADADLASLADVIKTSSEQPQPIPSQYEISADMQTVISEMKNKHPDSAFMLASKSPADVKGACNVVADLFETISVTLTPERSSKVMRFIMSQK